MTNPSSGAEGQPAHQPDAPPPPPPDVSWIEFDESMRNQDPETIEQKVIRRGD
jgi:hypothetical protein